MIDVECDNKQCQHYGVETCGLKKIAISPSLWHPTDAVCVTSDWTVEDE